MANLNHNPQAMSSISSECNELKLSYDECFNNWFSEKFLKGDKDLSVCDPYLKMYTECVKKAMEKKNIDTEEIEKEILGTAAEREKPANKM